MNFKVTLVDEADKVGYRSNSEVKGRVTVVTNTPVPYKDITISLRGESVVYLPRHGRSVSYCRYGRKSGRPGFRNVYVDETKSVNVTGPEGERSGGELSTGEHCFDFSFTITEHGANLPSSFNGPLGDVHYFVEARLLQNASSPVRATSRAEFKFVGAVDVGKPELAAETEVDLRKQFCCTSGQIKVTVMLEKRGFVPREDIEVKVVNVDNESRRQVRLRAKLLSKLIYVAGGHKAYYPSKNLAVAETASPATAKETLKLAVPADTEPTLNETYIKRVYVVKVCLVVPRGINSITDIPVVIGTCRSQCSRV